MVWRLTGDKPSYETVMIKVSDAILINIPLYIQMEDYICGVDHSMPLLLLGDTGSGKSALMAKVATMAAVAAETSQVDGWVSRTFIH